MIGIKEGFFRDVISRLVSIIVMVGGLMDSVKIRKRKRNSCRSEFREMKHVLTCVDVRDV